MPKRNKKITRVSIVVIALNEEKSLPVLLNDIRNQDYDHGYMDIVLVDSMSDDNTFKIMKDFKSVSDFECVECKENPRVILSAGWNVALNYTKGEVIIRLDAHASINRNFVKKNMEFINLGYDICGGKVNNYIVEKSKWSSAVNMAEDSMFGGSIASFRRKENAQYVNTLAFGAYRKEVFDKVGRFDERLVRTEDNEMHYRIRKAGYNFYYTPEIVSYRETRPTFRKLLRQKFLNGYWVGETVKISPRCFSLYHFIPLIFVLSIITTTILFMLGFKFISCFMWGVYWFVNIGMSVMASLSSKDRSVYCFCLPIMFFLLHLGYGLGTLKGVLFRRERVL